jgi:hypothetical protein
MGRLFTHSLSALIPAVYLVQREGRRCEPAFWKPMFPGGNAQHFFKNVFLLNCIKFSAAKEWVMEEPLDYC